MILKAWGRMQSLTGIKGILSFPEWKMFHPNRAEEVKEIQRIYLQTIREFPVYFHSRAFSPKETETEVPPNYSAVDHKMLIPWENMTETKKYCYYRSETPLPRFECGRVNVLSQM